VEQEEYKPKVKQVKELVNHEVKECFKLEVMAAMEWFRVVA
jgi:hypothetical protein